MLLGDLIARFTDDEVASKALFGLDDFFLAARIHDAALQQDLTPGAFARSAVQRFSAEASDEEWVTLIGKMNHMDDPGGVLLRQALEWALVEKIHPEKL